MANLTGISTSTLLCLLLMIVLFSGVFPAVADSTTVDKDRSAMMKYRQLFMETKGKHAKAIKLLVKNKLSLNHIVTHSEALAAMADDMLLIFPAGSMGGKSRAMQEIWDDEGKLSKEFVTKTNEMRKQATQFVEVAKQGNYKKIKKQLAIFANKGCRSCHSDFRGE